MWIPSNESQESKHYVHVHYIILIGLGVCVCVYVYVTFFFFFQSQITLMDAPVFKAIQPEVRNACDVKVVGSLLKSFHSFILNANCGVS